MKKYKISVVSFLHYVKLLYRSSLFILAVILYIFNRIKESDLPFGQLGISRWVLGLIWLSFAVEMILRLYPSNLESKGCQKQFAHNYIPTGELKPQRPRWYATFGVVLFWCILNGVIGWMFYRDIIDEGILLLIALFYSICDMICILFYCPFQTILLKNKCCGSCRIYNWDYAMMFTPFIFLQGFYRIYGWSLLVLALILLFVWEIQLRRFPRRFFDNTNGALSCANCKEKLCMHKKQLHSFWKANHLHIYRNRK